MERAHSIIKSLRSAPIGIPSSRRLLHVPPSIASLPFNLENGLTPFLSSTTLKTLAVDWQSGLLDRLNQQVQGTAAEHLSLFDSIIHLAKDRTQTSAFNLASEALNNSFFLHGLRKPHPDRPELSRPSHGSLLARAIDETYGSFTQFVSYFSSAANGITSPAYLWVVCDQDGLLGICPTFASGTILVQNRQQRGDWSHSLGGTQTASSVAPPSSGSSVPSPGAPSPGQARSFSTFSHCNLPESSDKASEAFRPASFAASLFSSPSGPSATSSPFGTPNRAVTRRVAEPVDRFSQVHPLLALAVAERAYIPDHGIWGKESYLREFWGAVDWSKVEKAYAARCDLQPQAGKTLGISRGW